MKRISQSDHFFLLSIALLTLEGCGVQHTADVAGTFSSSASLALTHDLDSSERTVATRICYAYQAKNSNFKTQTYYGGTFTFNMTNKDCNNTKSAYSVAGVLTTSLVDTRQLVYATSSTMPFNKSVQTSQTGFLSQLCTKIQNNLAISNTVVDSGNTIQISFSSTDIDSYTLRYFSAVSGITKIQSAETFKVRTQFNIVANQILGMDESYVKQAVCTDSTNYSELTQNYSGYSPQ
jgi:hypothetical protein